METFLTPQPLAVEGVCNARDLGGYRVEGGTIRHGRLIRGADLSALTPRGQHRLAQFPVNKVIDLRTDGELKDQPNHRPEGAEMVQLDVLKVVLKAHSASPKEMIELMGQQDPAQVLLGIYHAFVAEPSCRAVWRRWLDELLASPEGAVYFHCSAGKDRTGFAAAVVLLALGAERGLIIEDYLLSNRYRAEENQRLLAQFQPLVPDKPAADILTLLEVQERYLQTAFAAMDALYGGADAFLRDGLGVTDAERARLRALFVA
ncbi:tyrosine-protein phosphatase [Enterobacteriaceae bacterium 4M9]|nr:tyrosine-protein phosphatase [Enterobacteriaceae bacterium 4M9]